MRFKKILHKGQKKQEKNEEEERIERGGGSSLWRMNCYSEGSGDDAITFRLFHRLNSR